MHGAVCPWLLVDTRTHASHRLLNVQTDRQVDRAPAKIPGLIFQKCGTFHKILTLFGRWPDLWFIDWIAGFNILKHSTTSFLCFAHTEMQPPRPRIKPPTSGAAGLVKQVFRWSGHRHTIHPKRRGLWSNLCSIGCRRNWSCQVAWKLVARALRT